MKKYAFLLVLALGVSFTAQAIHPLVIPMHTNAVIYTKVINDTGSDFQYKVGTTEYTVAPGDTAPLAFEENTQLLRKDNAGNWVNWFVITNAHMGQSIQLTTLL